jgi:hypothetical protein
MMQAKEFTFERPSDRPRSWRRWFAFVGAGLAWTFHLLSIYAIGEFGCVSGWGRVLYWNVSAVAWLILAVSVISLTVALGAAFVGYQDKRNDSRREEAENEDEGGAYLSSFGFILSALFSLIIIVETLPVFAYLHGC